MLREASPDALDNEGWTPLMCQSGGNSEYRDHDDEASMRCLDLLVSSSKNLDIADINGLTAAMLATMEWREESATYLLNAGSNPNSVANDGTSFLMLAAKKGKAGLTSALLQAGADIDLQDKNGQKAEDKALLEAGVPPDVWEIDEDFDLPLQVVALSKGEQALSIAKALIGAGAEIDFQGDYGCTALARSIERDGADDWAVARYLIGAGANPSLSDKDGLCPAEFANNNGNNAAILAMLEAGMDANMHGVAGPLLWYCAWDEPDMVRTLLAYGANPNGPATGIECAGETPLQRALESFDDGGADEETFCDIAIQLINAGADPAQIDPAPDCLASYLLARKEKAELTSLPQPAIVDPPPRKTL